MHVIVQKEFFFFGETNLIICLFVDVRIQPQQHLMGFPRRPQNLYVVFDSNSMKKQTILHMYISHN